MTKKAIFTAIIVIMGSTLFAGVGTTSMDILKVPAGIKAQSMGGAYIALSDDPEAMDINPAGLAFAEKISFLLIHDLYVEDIFFDSLYYVSTLGDTGAIGISLKYLSAGTITQTIEDASGNYAGEGPELSGMNYLGAVGYGINLGKLTFNDFTKNVLIGSTIKVSGESLGNDYSNVGVSLDIGAIYTVGIEEADFMSNRGEFIWNKFGMGIVFRNLGTSFSANITPITIALGTYTQWLNLGGSSNRFRLSADTDYNFNNGINLRIGTEYLQMIGNYRFAVRVGSNFNPEERQFGGFTAGGGVGMNINNRIYEVNYLYIPFGEFGANQKIGLYIQF